MILERDVLINLILALVLSGLIGFERERHERPAGLRTHILVGVGATIIMMVSLSMHKIHSENDAGRIAAQVVSGVGFLGAGTIIKEGFSVKGLTTAASLWATAAIGLAIGANYYFLAIITTLVVIVTLYLLNSFDFNISAKKYIILKCKVYANNDVLCNINEILQEHGARIEEMNVERSSEKKQELVIEFNLKISSKDKLITACNKLLQLESVLEVNINS
ncbi:MgtC/SapB family protein [Halocella sp. SP3-1]|uniref:MgtC/SapB family protein n=1 Tax=Halocella sp. SP3-1 TaxID=2382161 RepID=UPI00256FB364|nr:MgtC/SapB family protein [Halocella sp. SP3-1]